MDEAEMFARLYWATRPIPALFDDTDADEGRTPFLQTVRTNAHPIDSSDLDIASSGIHHHPYLLAQLIERGHLRRPDRPHALPSTLAAMTTEEIFSRLAAAGLSVDEHAFVELAREVPAAWVIVREFWLEDVKPEEGAQEPEPIVNEYVAFGAVELWRRLLPEVPCVEDEACALFAFTLEHPPGTPWVADDLRLARFTRGVEVCLRLVPAEYTSVTESDEFFGAQSPVACIVEGLYRWCTRFREPAQLEQAAGLLSQLADRFRTDERVSVWREAAALAALCARATDAPLAELLEAADEAEDWQRAAAVLSSFFERRGEPDDLETARAILQQAVGRLRSPLDDEWDLAVTLNDVEQALAELRLS